MKNIISTLFIISILLTGCVQQTPSNNDVLDNPQPYTDRNGYVKHFCLEKNIDNIWYAYFDDNGYGWKNTKNDKIMVQTEYQMIFENCYDDTKMKGFAAVIIGEKGIWYVKPDGEKIIEAYNFDSGPDGFKEDLSRYLDNGKVGFMNEDFEIVIPAQFDGTSYFKNGIAKVCNGCEKVIYMGEHWKLEGGRWGVVDKNGDVKWDKD